MHKLLRRFSFLLQRIFRWSFRYPTTQFTVVTIFLLVSLAGLPKLKVVLAIERLLDDGLRASQSMLQLDQDFPLDKGIVVNFSTADKTPFSHDELLKVEDWTFQVQEELGRVIYTKSPFKVRQASFENFELWTPALWDREDEQSTLDRLDGGPWAGVLYSEDKSSMMVEFVFPLDDEQPYSSKDFYSLRSSAEKFQKTIPGVSVHVGGQAAFEEYSHEGIERNNILNIVLFGVIIILLKLALGTWKSGVVFVITLSITSLATLGLMGWFGAPLDLVSSGLVLMIAVAALQDFLFVSQGIRAEGLRWRRAFRQVLVASFFTSFTTVAGFLSLTVSNLETIQRFGLWAGVGASLEWIVMFLFLPALLRKVPSLNCWLQSNSLLESARAQPLLNKKMPLGFARVLLLLYPLAIISALSLDVTGAPKYMFPAGHPFVESVSDLKRTRGWEDKVHLVLTDELSQPEYIKFISKIRNLPNVASLIDPVGLENYITKKLSSPIKEAALSNIHSSPEWRDWKFPFHSHVEIYLKDTDLTPMKDFLSEIFSLCENHPCYVAGPMISQADFAEKVPGEFMLSMGLSLLAVALVLVGLIYARSPYRWVATARFSIAAVLGSFWAPALILCCYALFAIKINFLTCLFASVLVGMTGDNCIHYIFQGRRLSFDRGVDRRGAASITIAAIVALSCLIFIGSYFESPRVFGSFLGIGVLLSLVGDIWIVRALSARTIQASNTN